jgi:hypothetical protein
MCVVLITNEYVLFNLLFVKKILIREKKYYDN